MLFLKNAAKPRGEMITKWGKYWETLSLVANEKAEGNASVRKHALFILRNETKGVPLGEA